MNVAVLVLVGHTDVTTDTSTRVIILHGCTRKGLTVLVAAYE
jgi:hypothetical protein